MNESREVQPQPSPQDDLLKALRRLQVQLQATLILMIMVTGALNLYLLRQYVALRKDVALLEPQVGQMMALYDKATIPLARAFLGQLTEFARQHPDFQAVLDRYRVQVAPTTGAAPATVAFPAGGPATSSPAATGRSLQP
ncbi:MAG: hypothetical protein RMN51_06860 [Verrucomicrobiota bacterium]|nr:hypothetical protein [Limisphaera sp.]MDW8381812.1 hypothetical protein [Verrucomicrobiota bacterium]